MSDPVTVTVLFDFKDPFSYLAITPIRETLAALPLRSQWMPFLGKPLNAPRRPRDPDDRGGWHRYHRGRYIARDLVRYAAANALPARHFSEGGLYRPAAGEVAAMGYNWASGAGAGSASEFLDAAFEGYWDGDLDLDSMSGISALLARAGADPDGFDDYCHGEGIGELLAQREDAGESGGFATPSCLLDGEAFVGRQHLPFLVERVRRLVTEGATT